MSRDRIATYRLQLNAGAGFDHAEAITGYLAALGISDLYLSPITRARAGSLHGYDVVDHSEVNPELGAREGFDRLAAVWDGRIVLDIVPNHMAVVDPANRWWWDVLKHGPGSRYAGFFDIDWDPPEERLKRSILVPILGDHYGRVLEAGDIKLDRFHDEMVVRYFDHVFPLAPSTKPHDPGELNADPDLLHEILDAQHYRLAYWKVAGRDLNYRRFFAINDLAALRIDRPEVFDEVHGLITALVHEGLVQGLRVDHIDGLRYPHEHLERLREVTGAGYVVVEKILEGDERLPGAWPVEGTTGYDFMAAVDRLFVDPAAETPLTELYGSFIETTDDPAAMATEAKFQVMDTELAADIERLTDLFVAVCEDQRNYRDFTRPELRQTLRETIASFDVYRTYADARSGAIGERDIAVIDRAIDDARRRRPDLDEGLFDLLRGVLALRIGGDPEDELAMRFQQATGPVMAKAIEDTLFYRYHRFVALNEVGGDPTRFSIGLDDFHRVNAQAQRDRPRGMVATSTHDTKRSEDVRMRLAVLSEIPGRWAEAVSRWSQHNLVHRAGRWPDRPTEYLIYQSLVGAWPLSIDRALAYVDKATKEAKIHTSWIEPNDAHDRAVSDFVRAILADPVLTEDLARFVDGIVDAGYMNSLAQTLIKLTVPGIPDIYQGTEVFDFSLVDPDNRRPVDHEAHRRLLEEVTRSTAADVWERRATGAPKMFVIQRVLAARAALPGAFGPASTYEPLAVKGPRADNIVAFARSGKAVSLAPRLALSVAGDWADTTIALPEGEWVNALTGTKWRGEMPATGAFEDFPVAFLLEGPR